MGDATRALRRDAEANLERIVSAATAVVAEQGMDTSIEVIARRAGVGLGTVYRRGLAVDAWQRHLEILLAGLAPGPALTRAALTPRDMDAVTEANPLGPGRD